MDTDRLKDTWIVFNEKLDQQQSFKEDIIREILQNKSSKSLSRLLNYEAFNTISITLLIPFLLYFINRYKITPFLSEIVYALIAIMGIALLSNIWKVWLLLKIDFTNTISNNIRSIERYKIHLNKEKILNFIVFILVFIVIAQAIINQGAQLAAWRWAAAIAGIAIGIIASIWSYKRFYKNNIRNIIDSIEKLKDLNENSDNKTVQ